MNAVNPITVLAHWQLSEERVAEVLELAAQVRQQSLAEPGCLGYEVFRSVDQPGNLLLVERYRDNAAIEAHRATPHYKELVAGRIVPLLSARKVELLQA